MTNFRLRRVTSSYLAQYSAPPGTDVSAEGEARPSSARCGLRMGKLATEDVFAGRRRRPKTFPKTFFAAHLDPAFGVPTIPPGQAITSKASGHQVTNFCTPRTPVTPIRLARNWM